jgi:hypothetical protein
MLAILEMLAAIRRRKSAGTRCTTTECGHLGELSVTAVKARGYARE